MCENVDAQARAIVAQVRAGGDDAVRELTEKFDGRAPRPDGTYEIPRAEWARAASELPPDVAMALERAATRIRSFHSPQVEDGYTIDDAGRRLELRIDPLRRVGIYVPGGTARYPSSVLMNAIPAVLAGVSEIIMVTPCASPATLAAAAIAGVHRVFEIGGAQAIGALAYGTESIPQVDKIVGPGNQWVAAAKRAVFGVVDIDSVAGPSEIVIVADATAEPSWIAADLLAQAEHDVQARPVLVTTVAATVHEVSSHLARQLVDLPRADIARASLAEHGAAIVVGSVDAAIDFVNHYAPEHVQLCLVDPMPAAERILTAGAIFLGAHTPEAIGDYLAGPNHVLPTGGSGRFGSPLGVYDFRKRTSIIRYSREALVRDVADVSRLAKVEGLDAHGRSVALRLQAPTEDEES